MAATATPDTLQTLLTAVAADRLAILARHEASARVVAHYDFNNTYQYVVNREETHLRWITDALADAGAGVPAAAASLGAPAAPKGTEPAAFREILAEDAKHLADFVARWTPRVAAMSHARHRRMLDVVLGESREHQRLFEQAAAGFEDVLGRRTTGAPRVGGVLPKRWQA
ncbi:MAG: hypothetical protein AB7I25_10530 [Vicinamibacterales bacterium]